jgi:hypothetical protein
LLREEEVKDEREEEDGDIVKPFTEETELAKARAAAAAAVLNLMVTFFVLLDVAALALLGGGAAGVCVVAAIGASRRSLPD